MRAPVVIGRPCGVGTGAGAPGSGLGMAGGLLVLPWAPPWRCSWSAEVAWATASTWMSWSKIMDWSLPRVFLLKIARTSTKSPGTIRPAPPMISLNWTDRARLPAGIRSVNFLASGCVRSIR